MGLILALASGCSTSGLDEDLENRFEELENRVEKLERLCSHLNTNISSLQKIINSLQDKDYIKSIHPIQEGDETIGWSIEFSKSGILAIYDGKDGHSPEISISKDVDGSHYWTLDGKWMLDENGKKIRAEGTTPELKIEKERWLISYDKGISWNDLGPASGKASDPIFKKVEYDEDFVHFTLSDGTLISVSRKEPAPALVQSITFIPDYSDGQVKMLKTAGKDQGIAEFNFKISPVRSIPEIIRNAESYLEMKAFYTRERAVNFISLPILSIKGDTEEGMLTLKVSGENMSEEFYEGISKAEAILRIKNDQSEITSDPVKLIAEVKSIAAGQAIFAKGVTKESGWYDVNKKGDGRTEWGDAVMCWAAASANMLQWWQDNYKAEGNQLPEGTPDGEGKDYPLAIFEIFRSDWDNMKGSQINYGIRWYMTGEDLASQDYGSAHPLEPGGYFKSIWDKLEAGMGTNYIEDINGYYIWNGGADSQTDRLAVFTKHIAEAIDQGMAGFSLTIGFSQLHAITLWGYELGEDGNVCKVYVTDSDDMLNYPSSVPRTAQLKEYEVIEKKDEIGLKDFSEPFNVITDIYPFKAYRN